MIAGTFYVILAIIAVILPDTPVPNDAMVFLLIGNIWLISAGFK